MTGEGGSGRKLLLDEGVGEHEKVLTNALAEKCRNFTIQI
jgi:hypothetical protein